MANNSPQGSPKYGKCITTESFEEFNTPPQSGVGDSLARSESVQIIN